MRITQANRPGANLAVPAIVAIADPIAALAAAAARRVVVGPLAQAVAVPAVIVAARRVARAIGMTAARAVRVRDLAMDRVAPAATAVPVAPWPINVRPPCRANRRCRSR